MEDENGIPVGATAPDVSASLVHPAGIVEEKSLYELLEDKPVLLVFYTNDFTPDCIDEWCSFRDYEEFNDSDEVAVVGVSQSSEKAHEKFLDLFNIPYPLFSDTEEEFVDGFDIRYKAFGMFSRPQRSCFFIDMDGEVRYKWLSEHPIDPTMDSVPVDEIHEEITAVMED